MRYDLCAMGCHLGGILANCTAGISMRYENYAFNTLGVLKPSIILPLFLHYFFDISRFWWGPLPNQPNNGRNKG
jgi:hypothetical protein